MKCQCHLLKNDDSPPCGFTASPGFEYAINHDPTRLTEWSKIASERGRVGNMNSKHPASINSVSMRTPNDLFRVVELVTKRLLNSKKQDACSVANALARLVGTAMELLKTNELKIENTELRTLLLERHPELKKHLKAVS